MSAAPAQSKNNAPLIEWRILNALSQLQAPVPYFDLLRATFPPDRYPDAWRYPSQGGPPACGMAFAAATRKLAKQGAIEIHGTMNASRSYRLKR